jgi:predicted transcriptional regulator
MGAFRKTEAPLRLPDVDENGFTALRRWREDNHISYQTCSQRLGVSTATFYRYEAGLYINIAVANEIVRMTHGAVRYRDLIADFIPEYA